MRNLDDGSRWHYRRSLASRVTVLTALAVGFVVAMISLSAYVTVKVQMQENLDESLFSRAHQAADGQALSELTEVFNVPSWAVGAADVRFIFIGANGSLRTADDLPALKLGDPEFAVARDETKESVRTITSDDGERWRVVAVPAEDGQALVIAQSLESQDQTLHRLGLVMLSLGLAGVVIATLSGWAVAANGLRPVRRLTAATEHIARTEDLTPMPIEGGDEIARLSMAFNSMLTALGASRDRHKNLIADASHELRTPLTSLRTNLDLLVMADANGGLSDEARAELLDDVRAQLHEMTDLINDLVELARGEINTSAVGPVDLVDVVEHALQRVRRRALGIDFDVHLEPWFLIGESNALERAVLNVLDNAVKWSPESATVYVRLDDGVLIVDDEGPGVAADEMEHVFERFWRSPESRGMAGSGLGLSIVAQVVGRHSGTATAGVSPYGGARFTVTLPGTNQAPQ